ncbi:MAG: DNA replication/repair protein RecF [Clostridia bacterium]|nr:DNA replication/repair protein RecF [Clostridia bacterium]MBO5298574.1 DNA replication/repair protein RecF [Clostridia bacterium]
MILKTLTLSGFRNIESARVEFDEGVNILCGNNAQGKTNIMEAIRFFSECRSFRGASDKEMILSGEKFASVFAEFEKNGRTQTAEVRFFSEKRRELYLNDCKVQPKEFMGNFNSVLFYPEQLTLIKNGPDNRRRFMDVSVCQIRPVYYTLLSQFSRVLQQRNALLKSGDTLTLDIWDERFAKLSFLVTKTRENYLSKLEKHAAPIANEISGGAENMTLRYTPSFEAEDENDLYTELVNNRERDRELGYTSVGAHKDDFETYLNGKNVKIYGSQGQQRSCVMSFKLAEAEILSDTVGEYPLVLLDDVFSELDTGRRNYITGKIVGKQVIITSCDPIPMLTDSNLIFVENGSVHSVPV